MELERRSLSMNRAATTFFREARVIGLVAT